MNLDGFTSETTPWGSGLPLVGEWFAGETTPQPVQTTPQPVQPVANHSPTSEIHWLDPWLLVEIHWLLVEIYWLLVGIYWLLVGWGVVPQPT